MAGDRPSPALARPRRDARRRSTGKGTDGPPGLRTNLLVCMAAAISMIQANLLLTTVGKSQNSFVMIDIMRLPLGILTGMGFIGGGAILKKGTSSSA